MKARILLGLVALIVVMASSGSLVASADAVVPFRATYVTHPTQVDLDEGVITLAIPGEGKGTHLGLSTWYADSLVDTNYYPFVQTGEMTFTAANGDQLSGTFAGLAVPTGETTVEFSGDFEISAGAGRFEGMTATGSYWGMADMAANQGILYFDGKLTK
jgi:hypothetical protein